MVEYVLAKDETGVRFSLPAHKTKREAICLSFCFTELCGVERIEQEKGRKNICFSVEESNPSESERCWEPWVLKEECNDEWDSEASPYPHKNNKDKAKLCPRYFCAPGGTRTPNDGSEDRCDIHFTTRANVFTGNISRKYLLINSYKIQHKWQKSKV